MPYSRVLYRSKPDRIGSVMKLVMWLCLGAACSSGFEANRCETRYVKNAVRFELAAKQPPCPSTKCEVGVRQCGKDVVCRTIAEVFRRPGDVDYCQELLWCECVQ